MKKLLITLALFLGLSCPALAQCNGIFGPATVCGNVTGNAPGHPIPASTLPGTAPGGTNGQVQYNNSGTFGGLTNIQLTALVQQFSSSLAGDVPASGGGTTNFLRADGSWAAPPAPPASIQIFNPLNYGAVGDGVTDDTAALQSMCAAIQTAGSGWIYSPPGKTYLIFTAVSGINQASVCLLHDINGLRLDMLGSSFKSGYASQINIGGTATASDQLQVTVGSLTGAFANQTVTYTVGAGNTTTQMATGVAAAINANATLAAHSIAATSSTNVVNFTSTGSQITWMLGTTAGATGLVVTGAQTETMATTVNYLFLLEHVQNIELNDLTGLALSGYADSARGSSIQWVFCSNAGTSSFSCRNMHVNRANLNGGFDGVAIVRALGTGDWGYNIHVDGGFSNLGYPVSNQGDGINTDFQIYNVSVGRSWIGYNVHNVRGQINSYRPTYTVGLNDVEFDCYGFGNTGFGTDLSGNRLSGVTIHYTNRLSSFYGNSFVAFSHQQGDPSVSNIPTEFDDIRLEFDALVNNNPNTQFINGNSFIGHAGTQTPGDPGNFERSIVVTGTIQGQISPSFGMCFLSASSCGTSGFSGVSTGDYSLENLRVDFGNIGVGTGATIRQSNFFSASAGIVGGDAGYNALQLVFSPPVTTSGTVQAQGITCSGTPTASFATRQGAITHC